MRSSWVFPTLDNSFEYWIEHVNFELLHDMLKLFIRMFQALQLMALTVFGAMD